VFDLLGTLQRSWDVGTNKAVGAICQYGGYIYCLVCTDITAGTPYSIYIYSTTGTLVTSISVPDVSPVAFSICDLLVDSTGKFYVVAGTSVLVYDSSFTLLTTITDANFYSLFSGLVLSDDSLVILEGTTGEAYILGGVSSDNEYASDYRTVYILPPTDTAITVNIYGWFYQPSLVENGSRNWWSNRYPSMVINLAQLILESVDLNPFANNTVKSIYDEVARHVSVEAAQQEIAIYGTVNHGG
jgi:hypothetical protein